MSSHQNRSTFFAQMFWTITNSVDPYIQCKISAGSNEFEWRQKYETVSHFDIANINNTLLGAFCYLAAQNRSSTEKKLEKFFRAQNSISPNTSLKQSEKWKKDWRNLSYLKKKYNFGSYQTTAFTFPFGDGELSVKQLCSSHIFTFLFEQMMMNTGYVDGCSNQRNVSHFSRFSFSSYNLCQ